MRTHAQVFAAALAVVALAAAGCGDSPEDTAHDNGEALGEALAQIDDAQDVQELTSGTVALRQAVSDVSDDVGSRVRKQVDAQQDSLSSAVGDLRTAITSDDAEARDEARVKLQDSVQDLRSRASSFSDSSDSVANSFWDGVKDGYDG
jgi:imidazoleglycerol phosphate dehydratase HisB